LALTGHQIAQVIAEVAAVAERAVLLAGLENPRKLSTSRQLDDPRVSRSLLYGLMVLISFPADGSERGIKDIGQELDLPISTTYRYVHTLLAAGLLARDPGTRKYRRAHPPNYGRRK
jgi:DNA-binding MarR family transcriptional regulator